ncbi:hypothetical protein BCR43DRAFT_523508 [Syncephalastrum racemosum]|uniref:Uncharacterized protein n=1 Tax=Syncephalastrum racemosum TaxID=13706 RepID=A0A1X2HEF3_SYNRA|nr:hypothetical protein BCR43DRAFT_523508 [Syncephalastrum racemosum]
MECHPRRQSVRHFQQTTVMPDAAPPPYEKIAAFDTRPAEKKDAYRALRSYCDTLWPTSLAAIAGKVSDYLTGCNVERKAAVKDTTSLTVDARMIEQTIVLLQVVADMQAKENGVLRQQSTVLDLYLMILERMFSALPLDTNTKAKRKLEHTLAQLKERHTLNIQLLPPPPSSSGCASTHAVGRLASCSDTASRLAVAVAIAVKRSPIPDVLAWCFSHFLAFLHAIDQTFHVKKKAWLLARQGVSVALELNEHFQIHQMILGLFYTMSTIFMKAAIAYAEAPGPQTAS